MGIDMQVRQYMQSRRVVGYEHSYLTSWTAKESLLVRNFTELEHKVADMGYTALKILRHPDATDEMRLDVSKRYADAYASMVKLDAEVAAALTKMHERRRAERKAKEGHNEKKEHNEKGET